MVAAFLFLWPTITRAQASAGASPDADPYTVTLYDPNPDHLWNRLYAAIFLRIDSSDGRKYGPDLLDILYWTETTHLIVGPSHDRALKVLDEFIAGHGEALISDPVKRAVMQHDLWAVYDWTERILNGTPGLGPALELRTRLAAVIKLIALSRQQIDALPDNYGEAIASGMFPAEPVPSDPAMPFLPPALFQPDGPWTAIGSSPDYPLANQHMNGCYFRSTFTTFVRFPEGQRSLKDYLDVVKNSKLVLPDFNRLKGRVLEETPEKKNPEMPQIPVGTMVALVRQMILIDNEGKFTQTHLTESVQFRIYRRIADEPPGPPSDNIEQHSQLFFAIRMNRKQLFAHRSGGLAAAGAHDTEFTFGPTVKLTGQDPFEAMDPRGIAFALIPTHVMQSCVMCHHDAGIFSIKSVIDLFDLKNPKPLQGLHVSTVRQEGEAAIDYSEKLEHSIK